VFADEENMAREAAHAVTNVVSLGGRARKPRSKSPVWGAAAGRLGMVTAMTTTKMAMRMEPKPIQVSQRSLWIRLILATVETTKNATNPKTTLQVECLETALRATERPSMETPEMRAQVMR
jgi:hypothetical protein